MSDKEYYVYERKAAKRGPFTIDEIYQRFLSGEFQGTDDVAKSGENRQEIADFFKVVEEKTQRREDWSAIKAKADDFQQALVSFYKHIAGRQQAISDTFQSVAGMSPAMESVFQKSWDPTFMNVADDLESFWRQINSRPSMCVLGKRGQGKTTLLTKWLGPDGDQGGLDELKLLPTGDKDTTACLIRLTEAVENDESRDSGFLYVELIRDGEIDLDRIDELQVPDRSTIPMSFKLERKPGNNDENVKEDAPFRVCRFPVESYDDKLRIRKLSGDTFTVMKRGPHRLSEIQWYAKEVKVPIKVVGDESGSAGHVIRNLDVIDAPGADSMAVDNYPKWKENKNSLVFQLGVNHLDIMMLVCSSDVASIQLGGQLQKNIWYPWVERCGGSAQGRVIIAFTHAAVLFEEASKDMEMNEEDPDQEVNVRGFGIKLLNNVLKPLMQVPDGSQRIIKDADPTTWPPIFFFESSPPKDWRNIYQSGFRNGQGQTIAENELFPLIDQEKIPANLPKGKRCILHMVKELDRVLKGVPAERRLPVKRWIVRALCALLDPGDQGFYLLSTFAIDYSVRGPVALNHLEERKNHAEEIWRRFSGLLGSINQPGEGEEAMGQLRSVNLALARYWKANPRGPKLSHGAACRSRLGAAKTNANPLTRNQRPFGFRDVIRDAVDDTMTTLQKEFSDWKPEEIDMVSKALSQCLSHDHPMKKIAERFQEAMVDHQEHLFRLQSTALERIVRVIGFLAKADESQLKCVAKNCYETNVDENDLIRAVQQSGVAAVNEEDSKAFQDVVETAAELEKVILKEGVAEPYKPANSQPREGETA